MWNSASKEASSQRLYTFYLVLAHVDPLIPVILLRVSHLQGELGEILDTITPWIYLLTLVLVLILIRSQARRGGVRAYVVISLISLFSLLEETGYGAEIFHLQKPSVCCIKYDSLHDFLKVPVKLLSSTRTKCGCPDLSSGHSAILILVVLLLLGILLVALRPSRNAIRNLGWKLGRLHRHPSYRFVLAAIAFGLAASFANVLLPGNLGVIDETLEVNMALGMLCAALTVGPPDRTE